MEDGSAAPVENILAQSGGLGFYQKRLFVCTCFLQALTVSALIYASHCRPQVSALVPPSATNGDLVSASKCRIRVKIGDKGIRNNNTDVEENPDLGRHQNRSGGDLGKNLSLAEVSEAPGKSGTGYGFTSLPYDVTSTRLDVQSTVGSFHTDLTQTYSSSSSSSSEPHKHPRHFSHANDQRVSVQTSEKVTLSSDVKTAGSALGDVTGSTRDYAFSDVTVQTDVYVPVSGNYPVSTPGFSGTQQYRRDDNRDYRTEGKITDEETTVPFTTLRPKKQKRNSAELTDRPSKTTEGDVVSLHDVTGDSSSGHDVTSVEDLCEQDHGEEDGGGPIYLALTYLPTPEWMGDVSNEQLAQYNAYCQAVGAMLGAALGAMGADQAGRRKPLYVYFPFMLIAHILSGFAVSWTMLAVFRFLVGAFAGACAVVSLVFPLEFIGTDWRDACVCSGIWVVGVVVISLELLITKHWRYLAFISGGIGLPLIGTYFIASESARWLLCHQKFPDAENTLKEIISCNSTSVPDFLSLFDKSRACVVTNMHHKRYTFLDLFHSIEMTKWTFALVYTCLVGSSVYFCLLAKVKVMTGNVYLDNSIPFVIDLPLGWSAVVVNRCLGRRWCLFLYAVASGLALLSVLVLHMTGNLSHMPSMLTGMAVFGKIGVTASLGLVFVIAVEMYPTVVRCMGVAVGVVAVTGGSMLAEAFFFLEDYHYTVPFAVFGAMMASVGFAGLLFPETLQRPLPNILPCRHRTIPLHEGVRLVTNPWDVL